MICPMDECSLTNVPLHRPIVTKLRHWATMKISLLSAPPYRSLPGQGSPSRLVQSNDNPTYIWLKSAFSQWFGTYVHKITVKSGDNFSNIVILKDINCLCYWDERTVGHIIHGTFHPGDVSSKGCVVQGTHRSTTKVQETFVGDGLTLLPKDFTS
jgi:hypothetical protein